MILAAAVLVLLMPVVQPMTSDEAEEIVGRAVAALREHFDAVQIMVSWQADDGLREDGG